MVKKKGFTLELNSTRSDVFEMLMRINYPKTLTFVSIVGLQQKKNLK